MDKLAINIKAAKLLHDPSKIDNYIKSGGNIEPVCDIFTNPADREATVIALGEKHMMIGPCYKDCRSEAEFYGKLDANEAPDAWQFSYMEGGSSGSFDTYTEALAAAVEAV